MYREEGKEYYPEGQYVKISYFIAPNKHYTGNLEILDLDGKKYNHAVDFFVEKIGDARVSRDLFSQKLNVLPSEGYRADKIKVGSKNARELKIYTQVCEVKQEGDFSDAKRKELLPPRKSHNEYDDYDYRATLGELHFFDCKGKIEEHAVPVEKFEYRKRIDRERVLPVSVKTV